MSPEQDEFYRAVSVMCVCVCVGVDVYMYCYVLHCSRRTAVWMAAGICTHAAAHCIDACFPEHVLEFWRHRNQY